MKIGYHLALRLSLVRRAVYAQRLAAIARRPAAAGEAASIPGSLYFFSGTRDLAEQVACIRSFLAHAGSPSRIVVVGDGTHQSEHRNILRSIHPRLQTLHWHEFIRRDLPARMMDYAREHPLGKKVAVLMSVPAGEPLIFSDSDILFFPAAAEDLRRRMESAEGPPEYLEDCYPSLDERLIRSEAEKGQPVNSGFVLLHRPLDWSVALERLEAMEGPAGYFTEQTLFHLAVRQSGGRPLPAERYVIQSDDQWVGKDLHTGPEVVLRHYFSSIRYKMWLKIPLTA